MQPQKTSQAGSLLSADVYIETTPRNFVGLAPCGFDTRRRAAVFCPS